MRDLRKWVRLIHELGRAGSRSEELLDHRRERFRIDEVVGHQGLHFLEAHAFLDGPLHPDQTDVKLILQQFPNGPDAAVSEMVDVVDGPLAVLEADEVFDHLQDIPCLRRVVFSSSRIFRILPCTSSVIVPSFNDGINPMGWRIRAALWISSVISGVAMSLVKIEPSLQDPIDQLLSPSHTRRSGFQGLLLPSFRSRPGSWGDSPSGRACG